MGAWSIVMSALALAFAAFAYFLHRERTAARNDAERMAATATSRAADVARAKIGDIVEVKGTLRCPSPITAEFSEQPCAHAVASVVREFVERRRNAKGDVSSHRRSETISTHVRCAPFTVEDESGGVSVDATGALVEGVQTFDRFEQEAGSGDLLGAVIESFGEGERTLGYRRVEAILPLDASVYVLAVRRPDGALGASVDGDPAKPFVISTRSEEERAASLISRARWLGFGVIACAALAAASVVGAIRLF
jgi:hypothetical protein